MSYGDTARTRATEIPELSDPHAPLERGDFARIVETGTVTDETSAALNSAAETPNDKVLNQMAEAQRTAFLDVARAHPRLKGKVLSDEDLIDFVNNFQIGTPAEQAAYLQIVNASIKKAAANLTAAGYNSYTIGAAITRAAQSAGQNLNGAASDIGSMKIEQQLTIAGVGVAGFMLKGSAAWGAGAAGVALIVQSPHAADLAMNVGAATLRLGTQVVAAPLRIGMRSGEILNNLLSPNLLPTVQNQVIGTGVDLKNSFGYILDSDYNPENNPQANPALMEFLTLGAAYAPPELKPLLDYLTQLRTGEVKRLPTRTELEKAGAYLARAEGLVTLEEYTAIEQKRITAQPLTVKEKQQYVIYKYTLLVNNAFMGKTALEPQASVVQAAYASSGGGSFDTPEAALASLPPLLRTQLESKTFSWDKAQAAQFQNQAEQLGMDINFENLTKHGFVGVALTLYIAMTTAGMLIGAVKGSWNAGKEKAASRAAERRKANAEKTLSTSEQKNLRNSLADESSKVSTVIKALIGAKVLASNTEFDKEIGKKKLSTLAGPELEALRTAANDGISSRETLRKDFFALIKPDLNTAQQEALDNRRDFYTFRDTLNRLDLFYKYAPRGTKGELEIGGRPFEIGQPEREQFTFTTGTDILQKVNPRNFYRWLTNSGDGRTLRMKSPTGGEVYLGLRRNSSGVFEFNARKDAAWETLDLNAFAESVKTLPSL